MTNAPVNPLWSLSIQAKHIDVSSDFILIISNDTLHVFDKVGNLILEEPAPLWAGVVEGGLITIEDTNSTEMINGIGLKILRIVWISLQNYSSESYTVKVKNSSMVVNC
ncbi:hypothetical protein [Thermococcus sp. 2319x1]|uniref:hypothetical protein n=1 Tax=Thermococcus sp. 2319x1 TaxID=1674923 RepID=UPI001EF05800|nr:hypothetical protein [Thermococcus sp. 2319x1]